MTSRAWAIDHRWLFAACALGGVILIALSFLPWVRYEFPSDDFLCRGFCDSRQSASQLVDGFDVEGVTDLGDGYVIAAAGALIVLSSGIVLVASGPWQAKLSVLLAGVAAFGIALFDTLRDFKAPCPGPGVSNLPDCADGNSAVALWAVAGLGLLLATLAAISLLKQLSQSATRGPAQPSL